MPLLRLEETFPPQVLEFTEEFGAKGGILEFLVKKNPRLSKYILPGLHVPADKLTLWEVFRVIQSTGRSVDESIFRSTHSDDAIAYIWAIDNLEISDKVKWLITLWKSIDHKRENLINSETQASLLARKRKEYNAQLEMAKEKYPFLFNHIDIADEGWWFLSAPVYCLVTIFIREVEWYLRYLEANSKSHLDFKDIETDNLQDWVSSRPWYWIWWDESVTNFIAWMKQEWHMQTYFDGIFNFIEWKSYDELHKIRTDIWELDLELRYWDYTTSDTVDDMLMSDSYTQSDIDSDVSRLSEMQDENIWWAFLYQQDRVWEHAQKNGLRPLTETGLYIQELLSADWNFGTMYEHPHSPSKYVFTWRDVLSDVIMPNASPWFWPENTQADIWDMKAPKELLVEIYKEIIKTWLLIDDISLQIEFAAKWNEVYILQVRAFRKKQYANWKIDPTQDEHAQVICNIFWTTPEEGVIIPRDSRLWIKNQRWGHFFNPLELQKTQLAASRCYAPFDHEMTEAAYYPDIAIFWLHTDIDKKLLEEAEKVRLRTNGITYSLEEA